jgi:mono/diheme cytochrome c family protein
MNARAGGTAIAAAVAFAVAVAVSPWGRGGRERGARAPRPAPEVSLLDRARAGALPGDPVAGRRLYETHCASCHGRGGAGDGTAAGLIWPRPRDHTDASYMNARSDADLFAAIHGGGKAVERSSLMPAWSDRFDALEIWSLVAYVRSVAPGIPAGAPAHARVRDREVVLNVERAGRLPGPRDHRVVIHRLENLEGTPVGYVTYPVADILGARVGLSLAFDPTGKLIAAESHRRIQAPGVAPEAVDRWLAGLRKYRLEGAPEIEAALRSALDAGEARLREAIAQDAEDLAEAMRVAASAPAGRGAALYRESCARCHGETGRVIGPGVVEGPFRPRNFANGAHMNALSDAYLTSVISEGGLHWNLSGSMPAFRALSPKDVAALVDHVRSFAIPPPDRPCPCSPAPGACAMVDVAGACSCRGFHPTEDSCPHRK